jgi:peptidyl-prolyl cis-trans isomerase B (cyclophilin B)
MKTRLLSVTIVTVAAVSLAACGDSDSAGDSAKAEATTSAPTPSEAEPTQAEASDDAKAGECTYNKQGEAAKEVELPPAKPVGASTAVIETNRGTITASLRDKGVECTINSLVSLAKQGYYEDTKCHRLVPGFVLQCGDPSATGMGGPGYKYADELAGDETYPAGTLAMANAGPNTNGSQFFIVLADAQLGPQYTVLGTVDKAGMKVADDIAQDGNGDGEAPKKDVVIKSLTTK